MRIINVILGVGTALLLTSLAGLGIETFYPAPEYPEYPESPRYSEERQCDFNCAFGDEKCYAEEDACYDEQNRLLSGQDEAYNEQLDDYDKQVKEYDKEMAEYGRNYFMIANLIGLLIFLGGILLLFLSSLATRSVAIGVIAAGYITIISSYTFSWFSSWSSLFLGSSTAEQSQGLEFFVGLLVAAIVIVVSMWSLHKYQQRNAQQGIPS